MTRIDQPRKLPKLALERQSYVISAQRDPVKGSACTKQYYVWVSKFFAIIN